MRNFSENVDSTFEITLTPISGDPDIAISLDPSN
jgi:hypothetical protein